jgi:hypothetical protein
MSRFDRIASILSSLAIVGGLALMLYALTGCIDNGDAVEEKPLPFLGVCGERPLTPGRSAAFTTIEGTPIVTMHRATYLAVESWIVESNAYTTCLETEAMRAQP